MRNFIVFHSFEQLSWRWKHGEIPPKARSILMGHFPEWSDRVNHPFRATDQASDFGLLCPPLHLITFYYLNKKIWKQVQCLSPRPHKCSRARSFEANFFLIFFKEGNPPKECVWCWDLNFYHMGKEIPTMSTFLKGYKFLELISRHPNFLGNLWESFLLNSDAFWQQWTNWSRE